MAGEQLEFYVVATPDAVLVRWRHALGRPKSRVYDVLAEELEELDAVESVRMNRYSAVLTVAEHVAPAYTVAGWVATALIESEAFQEALRFHFLEPEISIIDPLNRTVRL